MLVRLLIMTFIFISCVGTIEDKNPETTKNAQTSVNDITFAGIERLSPVAHNKIEVSFFPAPGSEESISYLIYVNGGVPIELNPASLTLNPEGMYVYTVENLTGALGAAYTISVGLKDKVTGETSNVNKSLTDYTFGNYVANFNGIISANAREGLLGQSEIIIKWIPAEVTGVSILPKSQDPIAYIVCYVKKEDASSVELAEGKVGTCKQLPLPADLPTDPANLQVSYENQRIISGLDTNTEYFFLVRALHKDYVSNALNPIYRTEQNNSVLLAKTKDAGEPIFWDQIMSDSTPDGENGRTEREISWNKSTGSFHSYRVYYREILDDFDAVPADALVSLYAGSNAVINNTSINNFHNDPLSVEGDVLNPKHVRMVAVDAEDIKTTLTSLTEFSWYTYKVVLCHTAACGDTERSFPASEGVFRSVANIAPFNGIKKINDPSVLAKIDEVNFDFDPAVVSKGFLDSMEVFCYEDDGTAIKLTSSPIVGGKCDQIQLNTTLPTTLTGLGSFEDFDNIVIEKVGGWFDPSENFTADEFCFSIVPIIDDVRASSINTTSISNAVKKCKNIYKRVPTIDQFPGANFICNTSTDSITATYSTPSGGIYSHYEVFWREIVPGSGDTFKFSEAKLGAVGYSSQDGLVGNSYIIPGLDLGKSYSFGVLSYFTSGANKNYSDANANIVTCKLESPIPSFNEWVNIFAIGPKGDGRRDRFLSPTMGDFQYETPTILETLDIHGRPIEVEVANYFSGDFTPTDVALTSSVTPKNFDGIFGRLLNEDFIADPSATPPHQYSNSGIVRLVWKDIDFAAGVGSMKDFTDTETALDKNQRKFGYKVYRSEDGGLKWVDLTRSGSQGHPNQINTGLIHPRAYTDLIRPNIAPTSETNLPVGGGSLNVGIFVDYSVESLPASGLTSRAREYLYKIVPVFSGEELTFQRESSNPQHIVKVTLPPRDMALVHRLIANRDACRELGKTYSTLIEENYTCDYNGLGAKWKNGDLSLGATKFDLGGDLLVDRHEMGCNYSRGSTAHANSENTVDKPDFIGKAQNGANFQGCYFEDDGSGYGRGYNYSDGDLASGYASDELKNIGVREGDCIFNGGRTLLDDQGTCPVSSPNLVSSEFFSSNYSFPGALVAGVTDSSFNGYNCLNSEIAASNFFTLYKDLAADSDPNVERESLPSEPLAVGYHRAMANNGRGYMGPNHYGYRAARGSATNGSHIVSTSSGAGASATASSSCMINIPVQDTANGKVQRARWISANELNTLRYREDTDNDNAYDVETDISLLDKTVNQLIDRTSVAGLFDSASGGRNDIPDSLLVPDKSISRGSYDSTTPVSRIISSPSAKLPPLVGLGLSSASVVCNSYEVQTGTYSDGGFNETSAKQKKEVMERYEGILASRFPTSLSQAGTDTEISDLESSNVDFSCNTTLKDINSTTDTRVNNNSHHVTLAHRSGANPYYITGSSEQDNVSFGDSTEHCISKFGIQDLVGNVSEMTAETIQCDYSENIEMRPNGDSDRARSADIIQPSPSLGTPFDSRYEVFVPTNPSLGSCSTVEAGQNRIPAQFTTGPSVKPVFDIFGSFNSSMITQSTGVQKREVYNSLRSGDGYFLDFSDTSILPRLLNDNALALTQTYHKYFNPILGVPLKCEGGSCDNDASDNKLISTAKMVVDNASVTSSIQDFYTGDPQYSNTGVETLNIGAGLSSIGGFTTTLALGPGEYDQNRSYHFGIAYDPLLPGPYNNSKILRYSSVFGVDRNILEVNSVDINNYKVANPNHIVLEPDGGGVSIRSVNWGVVRGSSLGFNNFSSAKSANGSRYSLGITNNYNDNTAAAGFRCAIKINKD